MTGRLQQVVVFTFLLFIHLGLKSQVLHTENFNVVIDTANFLKGNLTPSFRYRNLKEDYLELANTADISIRYKNHSFTIANRVEYSVLGKEDILSGGFVYLEYVNLRSGHLALEPFFQMHWQEPRGLENKYAGGFNLRWIALTHDKTGLFFGIGSLYEFERWNYSGVPDESLPMDEQDVEIERLRGTSYISFKQTFGELFDLDLSTYYQPTYTSPLKDYRLAGSFELTYNFTKYLGLRFLYQNIYDTQPLVPISKLYNDVNFGITITF